MKNRDNTITVHIADDHQIIIDGLTALLDFQKNIDVVGHSLNGNQVLDWFLKNTADVLLLDINMPDITGIEVIKRFKKYPTISVACFGTRILSKRNNDADDESPNA